MVRTLHFTARGIGSCPGQGTKSHMPQGVTKKKKKEEELLSLLLNIKTNTYISMKHRNMWQICKRLS